MFLAYQTVNLNADLYKKALDLMKSDYILALNYNISINLINILYQFIVIIHKFHINGVLGFWGIGRAHV